MVTLGSGACGQRAQWSVVGDIHGKRSTEGQEPLRCVTQGAGGTSEAIELGLRDCAEHQGPPESGSAGLSRDPAASGTGDPGAGRGQPSRRCGTGAGTGVRAGAGRSRVMKAFLPIGAVWPRAGSLPGGTLAVS